jgi:cell division septum initiation protein DivIVA
MSMAFTVGGFTRSFSVRLIGFDRQQVIGFCSHIANDYERTVRELEHSRKALHALQAAQPAPPAAMPLAQASAQGVERILTSAQRIADEIENDAQTQAARLLEEAKARAADLVKEAEHAAAGIVDEAKHTAAGIVDEARREAATCAEQVAGLRNHYAALRAAFERAADTAARALSDIAEHPHETPDTSASHQSVRSPLESSALSTT